MRPSQALRASSPGGGAKLLRLFIQKIVVHEKEVKWSKHAPQTVEIHYADIGCMENRQTAKPEQHKEIPMVS